VPHVCYCFTPMRYAWQGRDAYLESWSDRPARRLAARVLLGGMRRWDRASAAGVTHFVAISETVRERIQGCYGRDSRVIHPPVDTDFYTPAEGPPASRAEAPYLVVSALVPYKKVEHAVQACTAANRPLVVIGEGTERARLQQLAGPTVTFLGWQPDEAIRAHYRTCRALLFPGEEDFGIVPVEALACGAPVIAFGRGGAAETIDGRSGRLYDEPGPDGLRKAIEAWEADGMPQDPAHARRRAEEFALPLFRDRLLTFLASVSGARVARPVPPPPHLSL
ncbi:MAG: glycosyltransferase, partial [Thermoleophilia bacterium]|nr:glycosyltransferase [Thermoleophilia bacterium]